MKRKPLSHCMLIAFLGSYLPSTQAFVPSVSLGAITPGDSHAAITKDAVQLVYDDLGLRNVTKSMKKARQTILDANASVDDDFPAHTARHCDAENLSGCNLVILAELRDVVTHTQGDNVEAAREALGRALHTLQDFYSHSNWIELGNRGVHPEIGKSEFVSNVAPAGANTCIEAPAGQSCFKGNLTTSMLTSGYYSGQDRTRPAGKCRHGGFFDKSPGFGGINKDMSVCTGTVAAGLFDSPHHDHHPQAADLAVLATYQVFKDVKAKLSDREFKNLLGVGPTLAFSIDTTGSMGSVIAGVRATSTNIVNSRLGTDQEPSKYVLTPFNDPFSGPTTVTSDGSAFKSALGALYADDGGDCPELAMTGVFGALSASDDGGELYLFTDASAKDAGLAGSVLSLATKKKTKLFFSLFGSCSPYDPAYFYLAENTGGQVFILNQSEASSIAEFSDLISRSDTVDILSIGDALSASPKNYVFPVDTQTTRLTISVSATEAHSVRIIRPDGSVVSETDGGVTRVPVSAASIYSIERPQVGEWTITVEGAGTFSILVNGQSKLSLDEFRFVQTRGRPGHQGAFPVTGLPAPGQTVDALADFTETAKNVVFEFRSRSGKVLQSFTLTNNAPAEATVQTGKVVVPSSRFFVYALGEDGNGAKFQRLLSSGFIPQEVSVVAPTAVNLPVGQTTSYMFKVQNDGPADSFKFTALDDRPYLTSVTPSVASLATGASTIVKVDLTPPTTTSVGTIDTLTFSAESVTRNDVRNFAVLSSQVIAPPAVGDVNRDGRVDCDDLGLVKASFGKRAGQPAFNPTVDIDINGIVDARDLAQVARQVPVGTICN
ncbi:dockerin type I domain-containing protein [Zoogloea dura]|uniref:Dockerin domain-containing protein n=1 Tax=Zoogloea dura TaxID=2728840 RepID=A0A848GD23_9RHOO|nr:dockerin type I domain-containing protein [Zoogloea dura]NML27381.1 hypothetical protein [Zoogloea dura]